MEVSEDRSWPRRSPEDSADVENDERADSEREATVAADSEYIVGVVRMRIHVQLQLEQSCLSVCQGPPANSYKVLPLGPPWTKSKDVHRKSFQRLLPKQLMLFH